MSGSGQTTWHGLAAEIFASAKARGLQVPQLEAIPTAEYPTLAQRPASDNIFFGHGLSEMLAQAANRCAGATVFAYYVNDPERYGVVSFDKSGRALDIVEKPEHPRSNWAVTGLYFYDNDVVRFAREMKPSARGELEITDINKRYLAAGELAVARMDRGFAWFDTGTFKSLIEAGCFVRTLEQRQGMKICCPEEIAYGMGYITQSRVRGLARSLKKSGYGTYLEALIDA